MAEWIEYAGSDEQIAEMEDADNGFTFRYIPKDGVERESDVYSSCSIKSITKHECVTAYWIIPDDPLREMKIRQAQTGQPVWTRRKIENEYFYWLPTTTPDWNIPNAEYSFATFDGEN